MKTLMLALALLSAPDNFNDQIDSTVVTASRAGLNTPVVYTNINSTQLKAASPANSLPMTLYLQPSVVSTSEGGTGFGYSGVSVRGVGAYQTNVTLNGITLNDAESQEVFWANIPSLSTILSSVQLQRGLGTSSNGPAAFGASINMVTSTPGSTTSAMVDFSIGSYNTLSLAAKASSGFGKKGFYTDVALSKSLTEGYMDNASADVRLVYADAGWKGERDAVKFLVISGKQKTGITWNGVPLSMYDQNRTYNSNIGDTDNYWQTHLQLNYIHQFGPYLASNTTLNYTPGHGFYEIGGVKDCMKNNLYVLRSEMHYSQNGLMLTGGVYLSRYAGHYYGDAGYDNNSVKAESDLWTRAELTRGDFTYYTDAQLRLVMHDMTGPDEYGQTLDFHHKWPFFNPRLGASYQRNKRNRFYASAAMGHREPARADIQICPAVKPEMMLDFEAGHEFTGKNYTHNWNAFAMEYRDMLLETGKLNDGGYAIKDNVPEGYRRGIEYNYDWHLLRWLQVSGNHTESTNRISDGKHILRSPEHINTTSVTVKPVRCLSLTLTTKYVGKQYWDNTDCEDRMVPEYSVTDINAIYTTYLHIKAKLTVGAYVNNLFNKDYYAYAWVYRAPMEDGSIYQEEGLFPQALRNFMIKVNLEF